MCVLVYMLMYLYACLNRLTPLQATVVDIIVPVPRAYRLTLYLIDYVTPGPPYALTYVFRVNSLP